MKFIFIFRYLRELPAQIGKWLFEKFLTTENSLYIILSTDVTKQDTTYGNVEPESLPVHRDRNTTCIEVCGKRLLNFKSINVPCIRMDFLFYSLLV